ncbi:rhomboid family intramembrane serine protease [Nocardioides zeae]|uniref:Rhomboid family intramembrane serine protease n=1 Tax=Nocardioides imazamoxiresistens TaxID=3231893 RepID=A0ABU3PUY5_9ACTN|nr:rhomboid family intramembrane serine protease [Nocardioides zeae]MDT9593035.1 rhomboid family intramembrane serine protease [Nocardioides zeae]
MNEASVGFQCPECLAEGRRTVRAPRTPYGGARAGRPEITSYVLIAVNLAVYAALAAAGGSASALGRALLLTPRGACELGDGRVYLNVTSADTCASLGSWTDGVVSGAPWQLLTSGFAHVDLLHIAFNMLALYFLGPQVERVMGRWRFLAVYVVSLLAGSAAVMWLAAPYSSTLGASGAIFGLIGALIVVVLKVGGDPKPLAFWLGINVLITFTASSSISWQGHLGGLLGGVAAASVIVLAPRERRVPLQVAGLLLVSAVVLGLVALRALELA